MAQGTIIHGIAASQHIDSSGEVVDIDGLDISTLDKDGVLNWAHKKDTPTQTVGKILKAKKIFSDIDCEDKYQLHFWKKCQLPFLYIVGELFDAQGHSGAQDVAAMFRYDEDNKERHLNNVIGFSVEGGKIKTSGNVVTHSVARKVTIDNFPCNKMAVASILPKKENNELEDFFKSESNTAVEVLTGYNKEQILKKSDGIDTSGGSGSNALSGSGPTSSGGLLMAEKHLKIVPNPSVPKVKEPENKHIDTTKSGVKVFSHHKPYHYKNATSQDHKEIADAHYKQIGKDPKMDNHHRIRSQWHQNTAIRMENRLKKAIEAGSGMSAAPSEMVQGVALSKESLDKVLKTNKKSKWLKRAEEEYNKWEKKEQFRDFVYNKNPNLTKTEIDAIGKAIVLKEMLKVEEDLKKIVPYTEE